MPGTVRAGKKGKASGDHNTVECNHKLNNVYIHHKPAKATEGKLIIKSFDNDIYRELLVPDKNPIDNPIILPTTEFSRLKDQSKIVTKQDRMKVIEEIERRKNKIQQECLERKEQLVAAQKLREDKFAGPQGTPTSLYMLKRSDELMMEQEDKIKQVNTIVLATKCRAIRNAQIAEKKLMEKQMEEENQRLDMMMEQARQRKALAEEMVKGNEQLKKERYAKEVEEQIKENQMQNLLEMEKLEEESRMLNKALIAMQKEDQEKMLERKNQQMEVREEFKKAREESQLYKYLREEEDRIADLRVAQFLKAKQEREEELEKEKLLIKSTKEREIARMVENQVKSQDLKAMMDELNAARAQEEKEKEWREHEKQEALKRQRITEELKISRLNQLEDVRRAQAVEIARDEEVFKKMVMNQKSMYEKESKEEEQRRINVEKHRKFLLKQINEKEKERIQYQEEKYKDGKAQRQELAVKDRRINEYLQHKIDQLKETNLPENYVKDIERQIKFIK